MRTFLCSLTCWLIFCSCQQSGSSSVEIAAQDTIPANTISDDSLLTLVQENIFQYFWKGAEPVSGLARERIHIDGEYPDDDYEVITSGGSGFGLMALVVGMERGFISRKEGIERLQHIVQYLEKSDRFHGVWPHWLYGPTGKVKPFSPKDDGGDLVETAYLVQGLLTVRQYLNPQDPAEAALIGSINKLWETVEWDWYTQGKDALYWHWSPKWGWEMNFALEGYNEVLITYILAAASPTHSIGADAYHKGWARSGKIRSEQVTYGYPLVLQHNGSPKYGGPLFWAHYSYLGLDPRNLKDRYADYWKLNQNHTLINRQWCIENPHNYKGYGPNCWGLTASYSPEVFYAAHRPEEDLGVITPTAALSSFPYTPEASMMALRYFYHTLGDRLWGPYGPYDAFSEEKDWFPQRYLAIDQGPIIVMIENQRTSLLWDLFMSAPEIQKGLDKLGFTY